MYEVDKAVWHSSTEKNKMCQFEYAFSLWLHFHLNFVRNDALSNAKMKMQIGLFNFHFIIHYFNFNSPLTTSIELCNLKCSIRSGLGSNCITFCCDSFILFVFGHYNILLLFSKIRRSGFVHLACDWLWVTDARLLCARVLARAHSSIGKTWLDKASW